LANCGHHLIIDEVVFEDEMLKDYVQALREHTTYFIGVFCALSLMQERELLRGDRAIGLSNDQMDKVHQGTRAYDLAVDTSYQSSFEAAKQILILSLINNLTEPTGFKKMAQV
jgi:chloramphenicol 3-O phosphotransferase